MPSMHEILAIVMAVFSIVLFVLFVRSRFKEESAKILLIEIGGSIAFAIISIVSVIPGSESNFELGPIKYTFKTPSEVAKFLGTKEKTFEARNTDIKNPKTLIFSASSTSPNVSPDLNFLVGEEYIKKIDESKDGKERIFSATLPPGKELKTASPEQVTISVLPNSFFSKFGGLETFSTDDADDDEEAKAIREYYKLEKIP